MQRAATPFDSNAFLRRDFVKVCTMAAAAVGLSSTTASQIVEAASKGLKPSVVWLHFQECTGCTESLLRTSHPGVAELILDLVSMDRHETLFAGAGHQAEAALQDTIKKNAGKYICDVEGSIPTKDNGIHHALHHLPWSDLNYLFIENVGNLVCLAVYDLGQAANVVVLAVTEGEDKPLKYPVMFHKADLVLISKIDLLPHLPNISLDRIVDSLRHVMPNPKHLAVSARTRQGVQAWITWLHEHEAAVAQDLSEYHHGHGDGHRHGDRHAHV